MSFTPACNGHNAPPHDTDFQPDQVNRDTIRWRNGGACADIYSAELNVTPITRMIAVKCFRRREMLGPDPLMEERIENELNIWRILHLNHRPDGHPNVAPILGVIGSPEYFNLSPQRYIPPLSICNYYGNQDLAKFVQSKLPAQRFELLDDVILGLSYMHSESIIHGDMKAHNVLVDDLGVAKISDFGSSRFDCRCTRDMEGPSGTTIYCSPELLRGSFCTKGSDVWAFGCLALEVQFGLMPYEGRELRAIHSLSTGTLPATREATDACNPGFYQNAVLAQLWEMIQRCWMMHPADRPSAESLANEFLTLGTGGAEESMTETLQDVAMDVGSFEFN